MSNARTLTESGVNVSKLEAKPFIGGRILSDWSMGAPFEAGAGWILGPDIKNPVHKINEKWERSLIIIDRHLKKEVL